MGGAAYCTISWSLEGGSILRPNFPYVFLLQAAPSRYHQNSIAHSRTWPWRPGHLHCFRIESIACPIFLQTTLDTGINRIQNRNHSITPRITPLHLIILHHVSLSYLYFTPHNPVHPVRKRSPQKKSPQTGSIC